MGESGGEGEAAVEKNQGEREEEEEEAMVGTRCTQATAKLS